MVRKEPFAWSASSLFALHLYAAAIIAWILLIPVEMWRRNGVLEILSALGLIGTWRYLWWLTHFVRAQIYERVVYARLREHAARAWASGWRPERLVLLMTTYREDPDITRKVIASIVAELAVTGIPALLVVGTGHPSDEDVIAGAVARLGQNVQLEVVFVRQPRPGKRVAIAYALRALCRLGVRGDVPVVFMDGDTLLGPGCLARCLPLLAVEPKTTALTTFERSVVRGPTFMQRWFDVRFAQRHMTMQSHALSRKVLTLTGRFSVFRASAVLDEEFIGLVEDDYLDHWMWGRFRFLSGDDKSTWFCLLRRGAEMRYVPDAVVWTIDRIEDAWLPRAAQNMLRWSGNMLRNGSRAIALGPRQVGPFIWWCLVDQRIAMWTSLAGPVALLGGSLLIDPVLLLAFPPWVLLTRGLQSVLLFYYHRRIDVSFPFVLYFNQILGSLAKVYISFRLPIQRWANRGDQRSGPGDADRRRKLWMANYLTVLWGASFVFGVLLYVGVFRGTVTGYLVALLDLFL